MWMIILIPNGHRQGAGHCLGWMATVAHDDGDQELLLSFSVKHPESRECCSAVEIVLEVEVVAVAILRGHREVEGRAVVCRVPVHSSEQHWRLVQPHDLNKEGQLFQPPNSSINSNTSKILQPTSANFSHNSQDQAQAQDPHYLKHILSILLWMFSSCFNVTHFFFFLTKINSNTLFLHILV